MFDWDDLPEKQADNLKTNSEDEQPKVCPTHVKPLPPWSRPPTGPGHTPFPKLIKETSPGEFYGLEFPVTVPMLSEPAWGAAWLTKAFHAAGTLSADNEISRIIEIVEVPLDSVDIAGGAARKGLLTVEYAKEDPSLHKHLFVKVPLQEEDNLPMRMQLSCFGDVDGAEVSAYQFLVPLLPFKVPKLYFCDISRRTTNFILITEQIQFAKKDAETKPYQIHRAIGKFQDYDLADPVGPYYALFRTMARFLTMDKTGQFDSVKEIFEETSYARFGGRTKYFADQKALQERTPEQIAKAKNAEVLKTKNAVNRQLKRLPEEVDALTNFICNVAPWLFPDDCRDETFLKGLKPQFEHLVQLSAEITTFCTEHPTFHGLIHPNPEVDNAYFWQDEKDNFECGLFDWSGTGYQSYTRLFHGCIRSALPEVYLEHEESWFQYFTDEVRRYGGPDWDYKECLLISRLSFAAGMPDKPKSVIGSLAQTTVEDWKTISEKNDPRIVGRFFVRTAIFSTANHMVIWKRGPHWRVFLDWCESKGFGKKAVP